MSGRGSRTRKACESTLYTITTDSRGMIMDKLKRTSIVELQDFEVVVKLFEQKYKDPVLMKVVKAEYEDGKLIKSLKALEGLLDTSSYKKLMRGVQL
jgi:hypothetical protein